MHFINNDENRGIYLLKLQGGHERVTFFKWVMMFFNDQFYIF